MKKGLVFLGLFALPFAAGGTIAGYLFFNSLWMVFQMRSWVSVPAKLHDVELKSNHSSKSTTYKVEAKYSYLWNDQTFSGDRVSVHTSFDNLGSYQKKTYRLLQDQRRHSGKFVVFVDPKDPTQSIIDRSARLERLGFYLIFVLIFGGVGYGLMIGSIIGYRKGIQEENVKMQSPREPWLWKRDWEGGRIRSGHKKKMLGVFVFAAFWNLISAPILFLIPQAVLEKKNYPALIGLLFPLVGFGLMIWCLRFLWHWRKFGESVFVMETFPGNIGGRLQGQIETSVNLPASALSLQLCSIHEQVRGSGKSRTKSERILWQKTQNLQPGAVWQGPRGVGVPVDFTIPADCLPWDERDVNDRILWRLTLRAEVPGMDYESQFEVPVFVTGQTHANLARTPTQTPSYAQSMGFQEAILSQGLKHELLAEGGERIVSPRARRPGAALFMSALFLVWSGIMAALMYAKAPFAIRFGFGLFEGLIFLGVLDQWFYCSELRIRADQLSFRGGILAGTTKIIPRVNLKELKLTEGSPAGQQQTLGIEAVRKEGKSLTIVKDLRSPEAAQILLEHFQKALGF